MSNVHPHAKIAASGTGLVGAGDGEEIVPASLAGDELAALGASAAVLRQRLSILGC